MGTGFKSRVTAAFTAPPKKDHREEQSKQQSLLVHDFRGGECWQDGKERASLKHPPNALAG
jgi:hypothetical protein